MRTVPQCFVKHHKQKNRHRHLSVHGWDPESQISRSRAHLTPPGMRPSGIMGGSDSRVEGHPRTRLNPVGPGKSRPTSGPGATDDRHGGAGRSIRGGEMGQETCGGLKKGI